MRSFCSVKDTVKRMRRQATDVEKIFAKDTSIRGHFPPKYRECLKLNIKKINNPVKKMGQRWEQTPHQRRSRWQVSI